MGLGGSDRASASAPALRSRWPFEAQLYGGAGNGMTIHLDSFDARITVFRNGGPPFAVAGNAEASEHPEARRIGVYDLVGPLGSETPVYVAARL